MFEGSEFIYLYFLLILLKEQFKREENKNGMLVKGVAELNDDVERVVVWAFCSLLFLFYFTLDRTKTAERTTFQGTERGDRAQRNTAVLFDINIVRLISTWY